MDGMPAAELVWVSRVVEAGLDLVFVLGVVMGLLELLPGRLLHVVGVCLLRQLRPQRPDPGSRGGDAVAVDRRRRRDDLVTITRAEGVGAGGVDGQVEDAPGRANLPRST
jgi:hypothetical protein